MRRILATCCAFEVVSSPSMYRLSSSPRARCHRAWPPGWQTAFDADLLRARTTRSHRRKLLRDGVHVHEVVRVRPGAAKDAVDELDEERRLDQALVDKVGEVVEVAEVVTPNSKRAVRLTELRRPYSIVANVFGKMNFRVMSRKGFSQSCWKRSYLSAIGKMPKFSEPMFIDAISTCAKAQRTLLDRHAKSATCGDVHHRIGLLQMRAETGMKVSGRGSGLPFSGSRACRCKMLAPASAAPTAASVISSGVTGKYGDMVGV